MEIRPSGSRLTLADALRDRIAHVESYIDKTAPDPNYRVETSDDYVVTAEKMREEKRVSAQVLTDLGQFKELAHKIHKTISGKINELQMYPDDRYKSFDRAQVEYDDRKEAAAQELAANTRLQIEQEDEARRTAEAATLTARGDVGKAKEVLDAPKRQVDVSIASWRPQVKGFGMKKNYVAKCVDEDRLLLAIARPTIYREIAAQIETRKTSSAAVKKVQKMIATWIKGLADQAPTIPTSCFLSTKGSRDALDTQLSKFATNVNGKIEWPGVAVEEEKKSTVRK